MIVKVDIDSTIAMLMPEWLSRYNYDFAKYMTKPLTVDEIVDWDVHKFVVPQCGMHIYDYVNDPTLYYNVKPMPFARSAIRTLRSIGHTVLYVSSGFNVGKYEWLERHDFLLKRGWRSAKDIIVASDKSMVAGDWLVDDGWHNITDLSRSILFDAPWNRQYDAGEHRAHSWREVLDILYREKKFFS